MIGGIEKPEGFVDQKCKHTGKLIGRKGLLPEDSQARKDYPMCEGLLDYFRDALAAVSQVSYQGNAKHNPGQKLHHSRGKSMDHADCIVRHLSERGGFDSSGARHSAQLAWRALALLQEELEQEYNLPLPRNARFDVEMPPVGKYEEIRAANDAQAHADIKADTCSCRECCARRDAAKAHLRAGHGACDCNPRPYRPDGRAFEQSPLG